MTPAEIRFFSWKIPFPAHYVVSLRLDLVPGTDFPRFQQAITKVLLHHDALRLSFPLSGERRSKIFGDELDLDWRHVDCRESGEGAWNRLIQLEVARASTSFDLESGPLCKVVSFSCDTGRASIVFLAHHLVFDGACIRILMEDVGDAYLLGEGWVPRTVPQAFAEYGERLDARLRANGEVHSFPEGVRLFERVPVGALSCRECLDAMIPIPSGLEGALSSGRLHDAYHVACGVALGLTLGMEEVTVNTFHSARGHVPGCDDTHLLGWLAQSFPVSLRCDGEPEARLAHFKRVNRPSFENPHAFAWQRFVRGEAPGGAEADVGINFLGVAANRQKERHRSIFTWTPTLTSQYLHPENLAHAAALNFRLLRMESHLWFSIQFDTKRVPSGAAAEMMARFKDALYAQFSV